MNYNSESCELTLNTTRICTTDAIDTSIEVSKIGFINMKPNAVILINEKEVFDGIAATSLVHFPINAPLLFTDGNSLSKKTLHEIKRLSPKGYKGIHVILVGKISKKVSCELNYYGFSTHHISGTNHYETAGMITKVRKEFKNILIMSGEDYSEGIVSGYWSAHHGDPILFVKKNKITSCTMEAIKKMNDINIYIVGSTKTVSKEVEDYLCNLDNVKHLDRIDGENPYEIAVNFAKYKDHKTEFGWGRNYREGHAFTFGELKNPMNIIAGVLFAHMGKHTPSLIIKKDRTPEVVEKYIKSVQPMPPKDMPKPPFMHGFILGATQDISNYAQMMIEDNLSIDHEMMGMEHEMGESLCMNDSDCMSMHKMHHPDHMMEMKHEMSESDCIKSSCMSMHQMHYPDHMMEMKHEMSESDCMNDSDCMSMHHPDHMMEMKHDMSEEDCMNDSDCMSMHHLDHMMKMKHDMSKSDCIKGSGCMSMHQMDYPDHMMEMKHYMSESDCIKGSGCMSMHQMDHPYHMMDMDHEKDKNNYEMLHNYDDEMNENHTVKHSGSSYVIVSIDEILS